jgi:hypothetical protein
MPQEDVAGSFEADCLTLPAAHAAFLVLAADLDRQSLDLEARHHKAAAAVCDGPSPKDMRAALATVRRALDTMATLRSRAGKQ